MMSLPYSRKNKLLEVTSSLVSLLCQKLLMIIVNFNGLAAMYSMIPLLIYKETVLSMLSCLPSPVPRRACCFWKRNEEKYYCLDRKNSSEQMKLTVDMNRESYVHKSFRQAFLNAQ